MASPGRTSCSLWLFYWACSYLLGTNVPAVTLNLAL